LDIQTDDAMPGGGKQRLRAGGKILQPCADRQNHVGLRGKIVGRLRAGDADRAHVQRMRRRQRGFAGLRFAGGDAVRGQEFCQFAFGFRIQRAAADHDQRAFCRAQQLHGGGQLGGIRRRAARRPDTLFEEVRGIVRCLRLHILAKGQRRRAAIGRVCQHLHGPRERRDKLVRPRQPVEIA